MTLEEAKRILEDLRKEDENIVLEAEFSDRMFIDGVEVEYDLELVEQYQDELEAIDTVLKALEDSIPKEKVREKIKERENKKDNAEMVFASALFERDINLLEELIKE